MILARQAHPAGDDARLHLVELVADDGPVRRLRDLGEFHHEPRHLDELLGVDPQVHAVEAQQRHHDVLDGHVARALAEARDRRVRD